MVIVPFNEANKIDMSRIPKSIMKSIFYSFTKVFQINAVAETDIGIGELYGIISLFFSAYPIFK